MNIKSEILKLANSLDSKTASTIERRYFPKTIVGKDCRIGLDTNGFSFYMEELPVKGKKKLRTYHWRLEGRFIDNWDVRDFFDWETSMKGKLGKSSTFDGVIGKVEKSMQKAYSLLVRENDYFKRFDYNDFYNISEKEVHYLQVAPADTDDMTLKGKDFTIDIGWSSFTINKMKMLDDGDMHGHKIVQGSPASARKLYKILSNKPELIRNMDENKFTDFLDKSKIKYEINHSVWR